MVELSEPVGASANGSSSCLIVPSSVCLTGKAEECQKAETCEPLTVHPFKVSPPVRSSWINSWTTGDIMVISWYIPPKAEGQQSDVRQLSNRSGASPFMSNLELPISCSTQKTEFIAWAWLKIGIYTATFLNKCIWWSSAKFAEKPTWHAVGYPLQKKVHH